MVIYVSLALTAGVAFLLFPRGVPSGRRFALTMTAAALCRLAFLPLPASDDVNRYAWEGAMVNRGVNPYVVAPDSDELLGYRDPAVWPGINHKDKTACYPPAFLRLSAWIASVSPGLLPFKVVFAVADLASVGLLLLLLRRRSLDEGWAMLYAFNPLVLFAFAGHGHVDALHLVFLLAALLCFEHKRWGLVFLFAGLAFQSKYVAVLALPFLITRANWRWAWVWFATALLPFFDPAFGSPFAKFASLREFGGHMAFGGGVHSLLRAAFQGHIEAATAVCAFLFALVCVAVFATAHPAWSKFSRSDPWPGILGVFGALLIFSPTVHFWYIAWVLPLALLRQRGSWILLTVTAAAYFTANATQHQTGTWELPAWALWLIWGPFCVLLAREMWLFCRRRGGPPELCSTVSVVIPTLNEEGRIGETVAEALRPAECAEVILVDAGSTDETRREAECAGARVLEHTLPLEAGGGRGGQILAGVRAAAGNAVVVLHADTHPPADFARRALAALNRNPDVAGGAFGGRFTGRGGWLRALELANDFRAAVLGLSFGDQIQFFRRREALDFEAVPDIPLMEDVELSFRLRRVGRTVFLAVPGRVSARRWHTNRRVRALTVLRLLVAYCAQRIAGQPDTLSMYRKYYG